MSKFGWDLPPGCSISDIDRAFGVEGPLDCPVCVDGVEMDGPDCAVDANHGVTCPKHGCVSCQDLEKHRIYCQGPFCGDYLRAGQTAIVDGDQRFCSERCHQDFLKPIDPDDESEAIHEVQGYAEGEE